MAAPKYALLVTGAAGGIGSGFVSEFLKTPQASTHYGLYVVHPSQPGSLAELLKNHAPASHKYEIASLDLSSLVSVRSFVSTLQPRVKAGELPPIRKLYLIAGGIFTSKDTEDGLDYSADGLEKMFAVNYLVNFLLVLMLLGSMKESARIVFMSSTTHWPENKSNASHVTKLEHNTVWKDVDMLANGKGNVPEAETGKKGRFEAGMRRYGTTKTLLNMFMYELQRRLDKDSQLSKISIIAMEPGAVGGTGLFQAHTFPIWMWFILCYIAPLIQTIVVWFMPNGFMRTPQQVGKDLVFAGWGKGLKGATYLDGHVVRDSSPETHDVVKQGKLWEGSLRLVGLSDAETALESWR
ncbi:hypothetical protein D0Z07_5466 [Hyphodiscus hymeniophilus]|uniref:NAD(P)-binding protein n=1 Tax=Hyphodiscus hymeniophilus TaxID=353542 RepID=A0A9P6VIR9_9HELO|nr:hypothetical protein D0Z07_5466 [Hyphodiscus hymeniophilus]